VHRRGIDTARLSLTSAVAFAAALAWIIVYRLSFERVPLDWEAGLNALPTLGFVVVLAMATWPRRFIHLPPARGRVVCIIPTYNEDQSALHLTIAALLKGTRVPDEIHVVDDGSAEPAVPYRHPDVFWYRQANGGKRDAQARVLRRLRTDRDNGRDRADFILTVDSDSIVDRSALRHLLRALSDPRVQAATGLPLVRNRTRNWLTRLTDLEISSICLTYRGARSRMGSITTCSGALSLYRADVLLDNLDDYVSSGLAGDDHRMTHYALLRGRVVSVAEALVHTDMPHTIKGMFRQRVRWSSSHWRYSFWEIASLPFGSMLWSAYTLMLSIIIPPGLLWVVLIGPLTGNGMAWQVFAYWLALSWISSLGYAMRRPRLSRGARWITWLLGVPAMMFVQMVIIQPAMLRALIETRSTSWLTRDS
jgi:hyaluronan synthase